MRYLKLILLSAVLLLPSWVGATGILERAANPVTEYTTHVHRSIPFIKASSGSMGNNGAISAMTTLSRTYSGAYLHLPANAIEAGSAAGWYWFVGSSATAGTVYNSTYTSGRPVRGTTTAFATTGPGAFTGEITNTTAVTLTIPANSLGINGLAKVRIASSDNGTGGSKAVSATYGGVTMFSATQGATTSETGEGRIHNRGIANEQVIVYWQDNGSGTGTGLVVAAVGTVDTTADQTLAIIISTAVATDHVVLEEYEITTETRN